MNIDTRSRLKKLRQERGLTLEDIARGAGVTYPTVQKLDSGQGIEKVWASTVQKIAHFLGVKMEDVYYWEDDKK